MPGGKRALGVNETALEKLLFGEMMGLVQHSRAVVATTKAAWVRHQGVQRVDGCCRVAGCMCVMLGCGVTCPVPGPPACSCCCVVSGH